MRPSTYDFFFPMASHLSLAITSYDIKMFISCDIRSSVVILGFSRTIVQPLLEVGFHGVSFTLLPILALIPRLIRPKLA